MPTFREYFQSYQQSGGKPENFALETYRTTDTVLYICRTILTDSVGVPRSVQWEQKEIRFPKGSPEFYGPEIKKLLQDIKETTRILSEPEVFFMSGLNTRYTVGDGVRSKVSDGSVLGTIGLQPENDTGLGYPGLR